MPQSPSLEPPASMLTEAVKATFKDAAVPLAELEASYLPFWRRSETLPKWDITINPT